MAISLILAHPDTNSFNHAIAKTALKALTRSGYTVNFHDLYAERFDPVPPGPAIPDDAALPPQIETLCREITDAEGIVIVHPNW
jgi:putative NADPH-quinone reductase